MTHALRIDPDRLWDSIHALGKVGAYLDERSGLWGVNRLALTEADGAGRRQVKAWMEALGLEVRVDRIGNCYGRRAGEQPNAAPVLIGSHIDSVPTGGAFDGALGVLGGLEVVRTLSDHRVRTQRPIEVAFFTDEEGARFGTDMLGSAVATGRISLEEALGLKDKQGVSVGQALEAIGFQGVHPERVTTPPHAYVECHIEQGPMLRAANLELGVVTGVQGISWQEVSFFGKSAHAGTTPMELRRDAGLAAARLTVELHRMATSGKFGAMRATVGALEFSPGVTNIVPRGARCTVDLRNPDDVQMAASERAVAAYLKALEAELGVTVECKQTAKTPHVPFSPDIQALIARTMDARGYTHQSMISGAGHDAQEFARICPTAMIFIPGEYDGISHNPREHSTKEQCQKGVDVLLEVVRTLAG